MQTHWELLGFGALALCSEAIQKADLLSRQVGSNILQDLELLGVHAHGNLRDRHSDLQTYQIFRACIAMCYLCT